MKRQLKFIKSGWLVCALTIALGGLRLQAASNAETREWIAALKYLEDAKEQIFGAMAESKFAEFAKKYPNSEHYAEAIVDEARAQYVQKKYDGMIDLLAAQWPHAGSFADQFAYWTAKAWEAKNDFGKAAENYARLAHENPGSPYRPEAIFREAEMHSKMGLWARVIEELGHPDGPFQIMAQTNKSDELVVQGLLLLGQAQWVQKDYKSAEKLLKSVVTDKSSKHLEWDRLSLLCSVLLDDDKAEEALQNSTNLLAAAGDNAKQQAKSVMLQGMMQESLGDLPEAMKIYETNLSADAPPEERREALLRIVDLLLQQSETADAERRLQDYLGKYPDEKGSDFEVLLLGELRLKEYQQQNAAAPSPGAGTNLLQLAEADFQKLVHQFTNSPYLGKAELNLGWCYLKEGKIAESQAAFNSAVAHLSFGEDQAVARFQLAGILFDQKNYAAAVTNYWTIIEQYSSVATVRNTLFEPALYQIAQGNLNQNKVAGAFDATQKLLEWFPKGSSGEKSLLMVGEAESPANARVLFSRLMKERPVSDLTPQVRLAFAQTYEKETNWPAAAEQYKAWIDAYPTNAELPRAEFYRAWAVWKSGDETNAFMLFTNFVARFQSNRVACADDLPAKAQYWVGDFFWGQNDFQKAESEYKAVFNKWPDSRLACQACMMAGKAAMMRSPQEAQAYFTNLINNASCGAEWQAQAWVALGDANIQLPLATNFSNFDQAIKIFKYVAVTYTNNPIASRAWGRLGNCYYTRAGNDTSPAEVRSDYESASNAFQMAMTSDLADVTTRSQAEVLLGETLLKMSSLDPAADPKPLLVQALNHWMTVVHGDNLRANEQSDTTWVNDAGLQAAKWAEDMGAKGEKAGWEQAIQIYERLRKDIPNMQPSLDKKIERARQMLSEEKK